MSYQVLIIDDDKIVVLLHNRIIKHSELSTISPLAFENGKTALDYLHEEANDNKQYLIFLDLNMPVMNGWEFLNSIQTYSFYKDISVVIVTSSIDPAEREKAAGYSQVIGYVEKPLNPLACNKIKQLVQCRPI